MKCRKVNISIKDNFFGEFGIGGRCFLSDKISLLIKMGTFYEKRFSEYKLDNNASSVYKLSDGWEFKTSIGFTF